MAKYFQTFITASVLVLMTSTADAVIYDLSSGGVDMLTISGGTVGSDANFEVFTDQPAGTGFIDPFLRTQVPGQSAEGSWCGTGGGSLIGKCEQGYNTDGRPVQFDTKDENQWTHSLLLSDLNVTGDGFVEFLLDINQAQGEAGQDQLLSLDELQFFVTADPNLLGYDDTTNMFTAGAELVWDLDRFMDAAAQPNDDYILLENCKAPGTCGSGDFDLLAQIAYQDFVDATNRLGIAVEDANVVLFNRFGDNAGVGKNNAGSNDGFEEWTAVLGAAPGNGNGVPEPGMASLLFVGMVGVWANRRRRKTA